MLKYVQSWRFVNDGEGGGKRVVRKPQDAKLNTFGCPRVRLWGFLLVRRVLSTKMIFLGNDKYSLQYEAGQMLLGADRGHFFYLSSETKAII